MHKLLSKCCLITLLIVIKTVQSEYEYYDPEYYGVEDYDKNMFVALETVRQQGNATISSSECESPSECLGGWSAWLSWTECNIGVPEHRTPHCHNTLRTRRRFCVGHQVCRSMTWELCVHEPSCTSEWSQWGEFQGNCSLCDKEMRRNRSCLSWEGDLTPGLCVGAKSDAVQSQIKLCEKTHCGKQENPLTMKQEIALIAAGVVLLFIGLAIILFLTCKSMKKHPTRESLSHVNSSSFFVSHWRVISRRFMRSTIRHETPADGGHEIAIGRNYSEVHVYENPNMFPSEYADVEDLPDLQRASRPSESSYHSYEVPVTTSGFRSLPDLTSDQDYEFADNVTPYTSMKVVPSSSGPRMKEFRRAQSVDNVILSDTKAKRPRRTSGAGLKSHRGVSEIYSKRALTKKESRKYQGASASGVASRITKRRKSSNKRVVQRQIRNFEYMRQSPSFSTIVNVEEDRYGYLVPNVEISSVQEKRRKFGQSMSVIAMKSVRETPPIVKSISLPSDANLDEYVTMRYQDDSKA